MNFLLFPLLVSSVLSIQNDVELGVESSNENTASFVVIADMHSMSSFAFQNENGSTDLQNQWKSLTSILHNYSLVVAPGDLTSFGKVLNKFIQEMNGGNRGFRVGGRRSKFASIDSYRKGWVDSFMKRASDEYKFNVDINGISSRPIGPDFEGSSYAYRYKNVLFVSADVFRTINNGAENYIDREDGYGGEGAITCTMDGSHAQWFENVLKAARSDESIKHIFVEVHVPIQHPVQKARCSSQFLDDQTESRFWKLMEKYKIDIYFAGEVHATTVTKTKTMGSSLLQVTPILSY